MPKVVLIDNFDRDNVSDTLHKEHLSTEEAAREAMEWNEKYGGDTALRFAVVKPDDYQLYTWEP